MRPQTERTYQERILRVLVHIQQHLDQALPLEDLARVAFFSPYHFHRIFEGMVGESVKEHTRRLRLERAAFRLKFTDQPITRIAFEAGYEAHESFTRAFRAMFGEAPSQFRENQRALPFTTVPSSIHYAPDGKLDQFHNLQRGDQAMEVRIERIEPMRVAFMRHVGPYLEVGALWGKLMSWAAPRGLLGPQATLIGIGHDDPHVTPADKLRYDACLVVDRHFQPEGDVGVQEIAGGDYAVTRHRGPYEKLGETYARLCGEWLPASGREPRSAPPFEIYRNTPTDTAPADLITDIYMPLES
jgi:AraC family transcriptional regulator